MSPKQRRLTDLLDPAFMNRLDSLDVLSRKILQGKLQGERRSKRRGQSVEFADYRPYVAGDDLRFVDWNIYGRLEQLFLKLFLEEQDLTVHIVVDGSASMSLGEPSKELFIKKLTAALGYVSLVNNNRVTRRCDGPACQHAGPKLPAPDGRFPSYRRLRRRFGLRRCVPAVGGGANRLRGDDCVERFSVQGRL
jgi:hypothetical protein